MIYFTVSDDRLDQICQQHYGAVIGVVEAVLVANPGLAEYGALLPANLAITLPVLSQPESKPTTSLWD